YRGDGYGRNEYRGGQGRTDRPGVADDEFERDWGMRESAGGAGAANPWSGPRYDHRVRGSGWLPEYGGPRDPWCEGPAYGRPGGPGVAEDALESDWGMRESAGGAGAANPWSGPRYDHRVRGSGWLREYGGPRDPWGEGPAYGRSGGREHESFAGRGPSGYRRA